MNSVCRAIQTDLTNEEALVILEPYFVAVQERYLEYGLDAVERVRLVVDPAMHDTARHFAACQDDGKQILLAPELAELTEDTVLAIIAHELGHATDFLYPGQFASQGDGEPALRRDPSSMKPKHWHRWLRDWERRDPDLVEVTADDIAHAVLGVRYGYRGPCLIQSFGATRLRPLGLR
jgi:hypothetical protein